MKIILKIAVGVAAILLIIPLIQYLKNVRNSIKRQRVAENRIRAETAKIKQLEIDQVESLGRQVLREKATLESWSGPIPVNIDSVLDKLHNSVQSLFRAHKNWHFNETGTEFNAEFLLTSAAVQDAYQIALDRSMQHKLIMKPGSPAIIELNEDSHVVEEYRSIYHYFLLAEGEL